jgi:transposase
MSITMIGLEAKSVFRVHAVNESGKAEIRRKLQRGELIPLFSRSRRPHCHPGSCGAAHHWARMLTGLGHDVKLRRDRS